jgi:hypothetical protein
VLIQQPPTDAVAENIADDNEPEIDPWLFIKKQKHALGVDKNSDQKNKVAGSADDSRPSK